jgi:DNA-binding HxlR family transcriptional regulator
MRYVDRGRRSVEAYSHRDNILAGIEVLNGQWVVAVLMSLSERPMQYTELRDCINAVEAEHGSPLHGSPLSEKVLTQTLSRMRRNGLVLRAELPAGGPVGDRPQYQYYLTRAGRALLRSLRPLGAWHKDHRAELEAARSEYDDQE